MESNEVLSADDGHERPIAAGRASGDLSTPHHHGRHSGEDQPSGDVQDTAAQEQPRVTDELRAAEEREPQADGRNHQADVRDRTADVREQVADEREQAADERDRMADYREERADERDQRADEREVRADEIEHHGRIPFAVQDQRTTEAIARSRARLESIAAQLDRSEALIQRIKARADRQRAAIGRDLEEATHPARPARPSRSHDGKSPTETASDLHQIFLELATNLAATEDEVAYRHTQMASMNPGKATEYQRTAETAREGARRVRAAADRFRGDLP